MNITITAKVPRSKVFSLRISPDLREAIDTKAKELNRTPSELASQILQQAIAQL